MQVRFQKITSRVWTVCITPFSRRALQNYLSQQPTYVGISGARNVVTYCTLFSPVKSHTTETSYYTTPLPILSSFPTLCPLSSPLLMPFPFYSPHFLPLSRLSFTSLLHLSSSTRIMSFPLPFLPLFLCTLDSICLSLTYLLPFIQNTSSH